MNSDFTMDLRNFSELWDINPYTNDTFVLRDTSARDLQKSYGKDLSKAISCYIGNLHRVAINSDDEELYEALSVSGAQAYIAYGHYRSVNGGATIEIEEQINQWIRMHERNLDGVIAAAKRCDSNLNPTNKNRLISGNSRSIKKLRESIWAACFGSSLTRAVHYRNLLRAENVLIIGETGTGKEGIARIIAESVFQKDGITQAEFRIVNAAAIPETLLESELFGHKKGSYTGALCDKHGIITEANKGTFFFDEIGDLPLRLQPKILRVLEKGLVRKIGEDKEVAVDVKFIGATHKALQKMVVDGQFREDLYHRFNGHIINTIPLRSLNEDDIIDIGENFISKNDSTSYRIIFRQVVREKYNGYEWPGNMRELGNVIRGLMLRGAVSQSIIIDRQRPEKNLIDIPDQLLRFNWSIDEVTKWYVKCVLNKHQNKSAAAKALGISYNQWFRKYKGI